MSKHHDVNDVTYTWCAYIGESKRKCSIKYGVLFSLNFTLSRADRNIKSQERFQFVATMTKQTELDLKVCNSRAEQLSQTWMVSVGSVTLKVFTQVQQLERLFSTLLSWRNAEKYSWPKKAAFSAQMTSCRKWEGVFFVCYSRQLQNTRVISGSVSTALFAWWNSLFISSCLVFFFFNHPSRKYSLVVVIHSVNNNKLYCPGAHHQNAKKLIINKKFTNLELFSVTLLTVGFPPEKHLSSEDLSIKIIGNLNEMITNWRRDEYKFYIALSKVPLTDRCFHLYGINYIASLFYTSLQSPDNKFSYGQSTIVYTTAKLTWYT